MSSAPVNAVDPEMWSLAEEELLLDSILVCGLGNWVDVSKQVRGRSPSECEYHYMTHYICNPIMPELKHVWMDHGCRCKWLCNPEIGQHKCEAVRREAHWVSSDSLDCYNRPGLALLQVLDDPPRVPPDSSRQLDMAGYNAQRSTFDIEYEQNAESLLFEIGKGDSDDEEEADERHLSDVLKVALASSYNNTLKERARRKKIIRDHGLISPIKSFSWFQKNKGVFGKSNILQLMLFAQFMTGIKFDYLLENLKLGLQLKTNLNKLLYFRANGLKNLHSIETFVKLKQCQDDTKRYLDTHLPTLQWAHTNVTTPLRTPAPPLNIYNLPGYKNLDEEEVKLCSYSRIVPESYISFKSLLISECNRLNGLRLREARPLIKIDVNKTRKIYDFLMNQKLIWLPSDDV